MFNRVMHRPLNVPTTAAASSPVRMAGAICQPFDIRNAVSTAVMPQTEPTERSIPPVKITKVMPIATIPTKEKFRVMLTTFSHCRNCGIATAITMTMRTSAAKVPASRIAKTFDQVEVRVLGLIGSGAV